MPLDCANYVEPLTETEQEAKADLYRWLDRFPQRVPALLEAVQEGRMNGSWYAGKCRCVLGTLASSSSALTAEKEIIDQIFQYLSSMVATPVEDFVRRVRPTDTPANSPVMAHLERWIMEWRG